MNMTTLELGYGNVSIAPVKNEEKGHGVIFMYTPNVEIGKDNEHGERPEDEIEVPVLFMKISSHRKDSLQVLINKLQEAVDYFG